MVEVVLVSPYKDRRSSWADIVQRHLETIVWAQGNSVVDVSKLISGEHPEVAIIDGNAGNSVSMARRAWPQAKIISIVDRSNNLNSQLINVTEENLLQGCSLTTLLEMTPKLVNRKHAHETVKPEMGEIISQVTGY